MDKKLTSVQRRLLKEGWGDEGDPRLGGIPDKVIDVRDYDLAEMLANELDGFGGIRAGNQDTNLHLYLPGGKGGPYGWKRPPLGDE
jgi:hypothetical protein